MSDLMLAWKLQASNCSYTSCVPFKIRVQNCELIVAAGAQPPRPNFQILCNTTVRRAHYFIARRKWTAVAFRVSNDCSYLWCCTLIDKTNSRCTQRLWAILFTPRFHPLSPSRAPSSPSRGYSLVCVSWIERRGRNKSPASREFIKTQQVNRHQMLEKLVFYVGTCVQFRWSLNFANELGTKLKISRNVCRWLIS